MESGKLLFLCPSLGGRQRGAGSPHTPEMTQIGGCTTSHPWSLLKGCCTHASSCHPVLRSPHGTSFCAAASRHKFTFWRCFSSGTGSSLPQPVHSSPGGRSGAMGMAGDRGFVGKHPMVWLMMAVGTLSWDFGFWEVEQAGSPA